MKPDSPNQSVPCDNIARASPLIRDLVHARTQELARIAGRAAHDVSRTDYEQAKREITGQSDSALQDAILAAPAESGPLDVEARLSAARPPLSESGLRHRVETFQVADLEAVEIARNRLAYRRMTS